MKNFLYIIGCSALLTSCHLYSNYERPESIEKGLENLYRNDSAQTAAVADTTNFGNTPWQEVFTDPLLQDLISKALANNTDLRSADLTIQQAEAGLKVSRLAYFPSLTLGGKGTISSWDFGKATKTYSFPLDATWQIGSFGSLRNTKKASEMSLEMAKAAKQAGRTAIIAAVANLYYTLQMLDEQLKTTENTVEIWAENVRVMELMKTAAMTNEAAVGQTKANYYNLQSSLPTLRQNITQTENALCTLLHEAPHAIARGQFNADSFPTNYSTGIPLQLLANRPDVHAAELQLAKAFYNINEAKAAFYPSLTIGAEAAWTNNAGIIVNPGKILSSAFASLTQPIFMNGRLQANLKVSQLEYENAQLKFQQTLLDAGKEVSNAITDFQAAEARQVLRQKQVETLTSTLANTQELFQRSSSTTYLEILTAQQSLIQAQLNLIQDKFDKVQAAISLYQALGGGREK